MPEIDSTKFLQINDCQESDDIEEMEVDQDN